jgi:hypothetical protein
MFALREVEHLVAAIGGREAQVISSPSARGRS